MARCLFPAAVLFTALASATVVTALADDDPGRLVPRLGPPPQSARALPAATKPNLPAPTLAPQHLYLIRATLLTLDTANRTGNYTVLRDSAGPGFQQKNSAADLAAAFTKVRGSLDLGPVAIRTPQLTQPAQITAERHLRLLGVVPGDPVPVTFEMIFEPIDGHWRLAGLSVGPAPAGQR